jgi:sporulation protein YlmC with PRC-barrel domain
VKGWLIVLLAVPALALGQVETRASRLLDAVVQNAAGELLGEVEDLVIDMRTGRIHSLVLDADNPGREDRLHAYRFDDFSYRGGRRLRLNVEREALRKTRGFHDYAWPPWSEAYWKSDPGMRLMRGAELVGKVLRDRNGAKGGEVRDLVIDLQAGAVTHALLDIAESRREVRVPMKELTLAANGEPALDAERARLVERAASEMRAKALFEMGVENREGRHLGEVEDLVIDLSSGRVQFIVLAFESAFNLGPKLFAYRLADFGLGNGRKLVLEVEPAQLRQARGFDEEAWPRWTEPYWSAYRPEPGGRAVPEASASAGATAADAPHRARALMQRTVPPRNGTPVGEVADLVVDLRSGAVTHAIIDLEHNLQQARVPFRALAVP